MGRTITTSFGTTKREGHDASAFYNRKLYNDIPKPIKHNGNNNVHYKENEPKKTNVIHHGDSRRMKELPDRSVHLMVTSPPYNVGKDYEDDLSLQQYMDLLRQVMKETYRVLVDGGRACINIANVGRAPYIPLHLHVLEVARDLGFFMRGEIIWDKGASAGQSCAWGSWQSASNPTLRDVHEYILVFCKGTYKRHPVKQNTIGRDDFMASTKSMWFMDNDSDESDLWRMNTESAKRLKHAAPFPVELPRRLIHLYSYAGDLVLDPFMGSGTTAVAALETGRKYLGYELKKGYVELARERIRKAADAVALL